MRELDLKEYNPLYPMPIHKYNELFDDQNANVMDRINTIINYLNQVGKLTNDVVKNWNTVYQWVMNDGLTTDVNNKLEDMLANGEFDAIIDKVVAKMGDLAELTTTQKETIVDAINSLQADLTNKIGDLTNLQTEAKTSLVDAINTNVLSLAEKASQTDMESVMTSLAQNTSRIKEIRLNVKDPQFGAKGDGLTDDTTAIQSAINYAFTLGEGYFPIIYLPPGKYLISSTLTHTQSGNYADIQGAGVRQTKLVANASMSTMLNVSAPTGVHTRKRISGITFDGSELADCLLDGSYLRYSTIENNEFVNTKTGGWAAKLSNWVTRFLNNLINGQSLAGTGTQISNGLLLTNESINNFIVENNSFTSCVVGLKCTASPHDLSITKNTFDSCNGTGIWFTLGGRKILIMDNYFENCGAVGVDVQTASGTTAKWYGAIVGHGEYSSLSSTPFKDLNILYNEFANCSPLTVLSFANLYTFDIHGNQTLGGYNYTNFLNLLWNGVPYNTANKAFIEHCYDVGQFTQLVGINTMDNRYYANGIVIRDNNDMVQNNVNNNGLELKNPVNWTGTWTTSTDGNLNGIHPITKLEATSTYKTLTIDLTNSVGIRGQYFNCNVLSKGITGSLNGLQLLVQIDGTSVLNVGTSTDVWTNTFRNATFYVPTTANTLVLNVRPYITTLPVWFTKFNISYASKHMSDKEFISLDL